MLNEYERDKKQNKFYKLVARYLYFAIELDMYVCKCDGPHHHHCDINAQ